MNIVLYITFSKFDNNLKFLSEKYDFKVSSAQDYYSSNKINLVLLDATLSIDKSIEMAKEIKKYSNIPIIFITNNCIPKYIEQFFLYGEDYIIDSFQNIELINKIDTQLNLANLKFKLDEEILFNDSLMESSNNILFIQDNNSIIKANNVFLKFFQVNSVLEFNQRHNCISEVFMEYENFYSKYILNNKQNWLNQLSNDKKTSEYKILIMDINTFEPKAFQIDVTALNNSDKFLVTLVDITKITMKSKKFEIQATYDSLTNVYNRNKFNKIIKKAYEKYKENNTHLSFAIFDIDFFKNVNDEYGHIVGDETLVTFAQTINNSIRDTDVFARWGGEEFTLLLPNTNILETYNIVEALRIKIENVQFKLIGQKTCSVGITQFKNNDTLKAVLERADEALYESKNTGRNKVSVK